MTDIVLSKNKILCYLKIQQSQKYQIDQLLRQDQLVLMIYHHHYPVLYYPTIYQHFKAYFDKQITANHIQLVINQQQIPSDLPIGLYAHDNCTIKVKIRQYAVPDGFQFMIISWKKAYTIVNKESGCNYVFKQLNAAKKNQIYNLHMKGISNGFNKTEKYEGNAIGVRLFYEGIIMQRKTQNLTLTIRQFIAIVFDESFIEGKNILTHGIQVNMQLTLKELLEQWNYNDGFCYLHIKN